MLYYNSMNESNLRRPVSGAAATVQIAENSFSSNSIFWIEVEKIKPNPYQPRREFNEESLRDLASSIKQYGILQPLTVTRQEIETSGGITTEYELIAGERRLRASKIAGLSLVPVIIRIGENSEKEKLELAIIENLQREDLSPVDRAVAFQRLADEFGLNPTQIGKKIGRSREYVSNSIRLLGLPEEVLTSLRDRKITEGHARTLLMLSDKPAEQSTVHKEILFKKLTVREVERIARKIAFERVRKHGEDTNPEILSFERELTEKLGTRVQIKQEEFGGRIMIDYFSPEDLTNILLLIEKGRQEGVSVNDPLRREAEAISTGNNLDAASLETEPDANEAPIDDKPESEKEPEDLYSIRDFNI